MSHRLILLPRPLEVQATVLPALDYRPPAAGRLHVAIHLHRESGDQQNELSGRGVGKPALGR